MRILLTAMRCEKAAPDANLAAHLSVLAEASQAGCDLAVFPEMSLTGSVDPIRHPERLTRLDDALVQAMVEGTRHSGVAALFGIAERDGPLAFITQVCARDGEVVGAQRKRHLGEDELGFSTDDATITFEVGATRVGAIICAESGVDHTWDATFASGARLLLLTAAPGLYGRRVTEVAWRDGFEWWERDGLGAAIRQARRLAVWVGVATQAGATSDEDFPGLAALVAPSGEVVARLPDWHAGTLVVDVG